MQRSRHRPGQPGPRTPRPARPATLPGHPVAPRGRPAGAARPNPCPASCVVSSCPESPIGRDPSAAAGAGARTDIVESNLPRSLPTRGRAAAATAGELTRSESEVHRRPKPAVGRSPKTGDSSGAHARPGTRAPARALSICDHHPTLPREAPSNPTLAFAESRQYWVAMAGREAGATLLRIPGQGPKVPPKVEREETSCVPRRHAQEPQ
jgi:hypothetical protein